MNGDFDKPTELYDPQQQGHGAAGGDWVNPQEGLRSAKKTEVLNPKGPRIFAMLVGVKGTPSIIGQVFRLDPNEPTTIGRDYACDIVIDEPAVSRQHAKVKLEEVERGRYQFFIQDLATDNGIKINGQKSIKHYLEEGDRITLGRNTLVFKWIEENGEEVRKSFGGDIVLKKLHIPIVGAVLVLISFFLPWISVSCMGSTVAQVSGFDLAQGIPDIGISSDFLFWAIPLAALISLIIAVLTMRDESIEDRTGIGHIVLGVAGLGILIVQWLRLNSSMEGAGGGLIPADLMGAMVDVEWGVWLTIAGFLILLIGGVLSYLEARNHSGVYASGQPAISYPTNLNTSPLPGTELGPPLPSTDLPPLGATAEMRPQFGAGVYDSAPRAVASPKTEVLERPGSKLMAWLVVTEGQRAGHRFRLTEVSSLGRDPANDIVIDDSALSGNHARIKLEEGDKFYLYDLASTNGVFVRPVNGADWEKIYRYELQEGDKVKIGRTVMHFMVVDDGKAQDEMASGAGTPE